jgi:hypothetical protein
MMETKWTYPLEHAKVEAGLYNNASEVIREAE